MWFDSELIVRLFGFQNEIELFEDTLTLPGFPSFPSKEVGSSEEEYIDSDDAAISRPHAQTAVSPHLLFSDSKPVMASAGSMRRGQGLKRRYVPYGGLHKLVRPYSLVNLFLFYSLLYSHPYVCI